jgi:hypothetical protein
VEESDLTAILAALPSPEGAPELWWLLERSYHLLVRDLGRPEAGGRWPALPAALGAQGRCFWVFVFLAAVPDVRRWHQARGLAEADSWATLADLGRHVASYRRRHGSPGLDSQFWLSLHFRGLLVALGRLQYLPYRLRTGPGGPLFWYDAPAAESLGRGFRPGDPALSLHVPAGGPLTPDACDESLRAAGPFFADHFPDPGPRLVTCTSWLLDERLAEQLPGESNIVRFQARFQMVPGAREDDGEVLRFVFGAVPKSLDDLRPRTRLEQAIVRRLRAGRHWRVRTGWLDLAQPPPERATQTRPLPSER